MAALLVQVVSDLCEKYSPQIIILYSSRAKGDLTPASNIISSALRLKSAAASNFKPSNPNSVPAVFDRPLPSCVSRSMYCFPLNLIDEQPLGSFQNGRPLFESFGESQITFTAFSRLARYKIE
ncbi:hypothetical protein H6F80_00805 [Leptolyngbya sp. FACHB-711]|nr:hypothetical protein [Leptolyngbya sp. FACHB-711]